MSSCNGQESNQLSSQKLIVLPLRINHPLPRSQRSFVWQMLHQTWEQRPGEEWPWGYFLLRTFAQISLEPDWRSQLRLARRARLRHLEFLMPKPSSSFGWETVSQLRRYSLFFCKVSPHKKFLLSLSNSVQIFPGSIVHCMIWVGMAVVIAWIKVHLPVRDKVLTFQLASSF